MPELPEVETIRRGLEKELMNAVISDFEVRDQRLLSPKRVKAWKPQLAGQSLKHFHRQGKYLELGLANGQRFFVHLRMTGQLLIHQPADAPPVLWRMKLTFSQGDALYFVDQRRFGEIWLLAPEDPGPSRQPLGPDALDLSLDTFKKQAASKKGPIQSVLLDQSVLAGVGNIYAQEALFSSGIRPSRRADRLTQAETQALHVALQATLHAAIHSRGSSSRNYRDVYGEQGSAQVAHAVYRKTGQPCPRCKKPLRALRVGGRGTVYCSACQS